MIRLKLVSTVDGQSPLVRLLWHLKNVFKRAGCPAIQRFQTLKTDCILKSRFVLNKAMHLRTNETPLGRISQVQHAKVVVVESMRLTRELLGQWLTRELDLVVLALFGCATKALDFCLVEEPDLIICDLFLPGSNPIELLRRVRSDLPRTRTLICSGAVDESITVDAFREQPDGFISKSGSLATFREAIESVLVGNTYYTCLPTKLLQDPSAVGFGRPLLSTREREVLKLVAEGFSTKQIAQRLGLAAKTIENYRARLMVKLEVRNSARLACQAVGLGLV